jgi:uncharacterized RDD family membrane protein YckC
MQCARCGLTNPETAIQCDCGYDLRTGAIAVGTPRTLGLPLATYGQRFAGHFLDSAVSGGGIALGTYIGASLGVGPTPAVVMFVAYMLLADGLGNGQSFGKKLMKIAVVDQRTGAPCTFAGSLFRNLVRVLGVFDWAFAFGQRRQRLGDKAAGTIVVRIRS